ncbi:MAG TPA: HAD-IC family P-type ATPase [Acidimicrobiales bacterium]|nr:HAD-IC family P-type ATPase [Acidimicrobiales bacterium]
MESEQPAESLVVGDVVLLSAGDQVPADGRILEASSLQIDESALTGESVLAAKESGPIPSDGLAPGDQRNMAFMNCPVTHGSGLMVVTGTGAGTELGRISGLLQATRKEQSPLTRELNTLSLWIVAAAGITMMVMFVSGRSRGQTWDALFISAVSLAIAAIPEALPTVTQVILSVGSVELAGRHAIVKDLPSVETLGFTSAINSDKTGTLTLNQMTAVEVVGPRDRYTVSGNCYGLDGTVTHVAGESPVIDQVGLPTTPGWSTGAWSATRRRERCWSSRTRPGWVSRRHRLASRAWRTLPFDPSYKLMATFNSASGPSGEPVVRCFVKGAGPAVLSRSSTPPQPGDPSRSDGQLARRAEAETERLERQGMRVMAAATRDLDPAPFDPAGDLLAYVTDRRLTGLVGMVDPPRAESKAAVASAQAAHIRVRMVTGDDVITGAAVAAQVGIPGEAVLGAELAAMSEQERLARMDGIGVVGRVAPEHKVLLADTLKKRGDVVAMTGDGVNDAPAIKAADIGIAMGSGTDVAKNAGRLILSDDNFATIVYAVEQGRKIFDNLTKYVRFVLLLLVAFVLSFLGATIFAIAAGEPFNPAQVLWIHFLVNAPFGFALGFDEESPGLMARTPRPRGHSLLTRPLLTTVGLVGLAIAAGNLALIQLGKSQFGDVAIGSSIAFTSFAFMLIVAAFESRSETATVFTTATFSSKQMNRAAIGEFVVAVLTTQMDALRRILGTVDLSMKEFRWSLLPPLGLLALWELGKWLARRRAAHRPAALGAPASGPSPGPVGP